ncbi:MAG: hypothetical protein EXS32_07870 [Opitutus sp.]|nr:hypothetical protein [Opitutus sp.]
MKARSHLKSLLATILLLAGASVSGAAETPAAAAATAGTQKLIDRVKAQGDQVIADRQAMIDQLKNATAEHRKAILEKMQAQQKDLLDAQRALGKQIRDELRKLRQSQPAPGGR